jgi:N-acetylglucosamine kinase-like BadF-type ATPase
MRFFLGIDGGGTHTAAWLADADGAVLARGEAGPSNPNKVGLHAAGREIVRAYRECWRKAGLAAAGAKAGRAAKLHVLCAGISGVGRPSVQRPLLAYLRRHIPARRYLLTSDAIIALAAAVQDGVGIIVNAGTGSFAFARDGEGKVLRAGGWGVPFDDPGSGYDLGRRAVAAALEAFDGRGAPTLLAERICRQLKLGDITEIISLQLQQHEIAALFPLVIDAARDGDLVAEYLCDSAARELAALAMALLKRAGWTRRRIPVVLTGGVFRSSDLIRRAFARHLGRRAPRVRLEMLERPPVEGALWLARRAGQSGLRKKA